MTKDFFLPRSRAAVAVLTTIFIAACSDPVREPTAPGKALPPIPSQLGTRSFSYQDGSQITVYHDEGGWVRLDAAANTLTNEEGTVIPLTDDQKVAFLNDFQGSVVYDQLANGVSGLAGCEVCIEPTGADPVPLGLPQPSSGGKLIVDVVEKTPSETKPNDRFGAVVVDLDKTLKDLSKAAKKSGNATTL
jgi:hypothetical protein